MQISQMESVEIRPIRIHPYSSVSFHSEQNNR